MEKNKDKGIPLSPKHGLNPSLVCCFVCGEETDEIALLGKLKDDAEAPKHIMTGSLCKECQQHVDNGGGFLIEARKDQSRTGRYFKLKQKFKQMEGPIAFMLDEDFENLIKDIENGSSKGQDTKQS